MAKKIEFTVKEDGTVNLEAQGYLGGECRAGTEAYEKALGGEIVSRREKKETVKERTIIKTGKM
jgi:hypothetical protein